MHLTSKIHAAKHFASGIANAQQGLAAQNPTRVALNGLFFLAMIYTLYLAADLFIPIAFAIFLTLVMSPMVERLARWHIPRSLSAGILVSALFSVLATAVLILDEPAEKWVQDAPRNIRQLQRQLLPAKGRLANIQELAEEVDELKSVEQKKKPQPVVVKGPGFMEGVLVNLPSILAGTAVVIFLTYFLLAAGDSLLRRLTSCGRTWRERRCIVSIARHIQSDVSRYLATVAVINICLGAATALSMYLVGVPNPLLWGVMVAVLNFAPYIGAFVSTLVLCLVGFVTFKTLSQGLIVPGVFLALTILEGQLITPSVLGRRMALSPAIIFLAVIVWGWIWGVAGALMAVPIVISVKAVVEHFPPAGFLAAFLSKTRSPVGRTMSRNVNYVQHVLE